MAIYDDKRNSEQSESLASGIHRDPNDVGSARMVFDPASNSYVYGWQQPDGSVLPVQAGTSATGDNGMGGKSYSGTLANPADPGSFAPYISAPAPGGGGGGGGVPGKLFNALVSDKKTQSIIGIGANLIGNLIQSRQTSKAVDAQVQASKDAMALQQRIYDQQRTDLEPYRNAGAASISTLTNMMGLPSGASGPARPSNYATGPGGEPGRMAARNPNQMGNTTFVPETNYSGTTAVPRGSLATLGAPQQAQSQSGYVTMQSPDGRTGRVPAAMVDQAVAAGGRVVGGVS